MYLITWQKDSISKIHDHSENGCLMKILEGKISENLYDSNLNHIKNNIYYKDNIAYIDNLIGYHSIKNIHTKPSYSLHIYSPTNYKTKYYN